MTEVEFIFLFAFLLTLILYSTLMLYFKIVTCAIMIFNFQTFKSNEPPLGD